MNDTSLMKEISSENPVNAKQRGTALLELLSEFGHEFIAALEASRKGDLPPQERESL
jgi:hypothetical protein